MHSLISIEQPVYKVCLVTEAVKWTWNARLIKKKNLTFRRFDLPIAPILDKTRIRMIVALFSQYFAASCSTHDIFKDILNVTHGRIYSTDSNEDFICGQNVSKLYE